MHNALGVLASLCLGSQAWADRIEPTPKELEGVDLEEKLSAPLPLAQTFVDSNGRTLEFGELFSDKPVILTFNYSNCPMLCSVQLGGLVDTMLNMPWSISSDFEIISISLDPDEGPGHAADTKAKYLERYRRDGAEAGWHFLTGSEASIKAVADAVGFGYSYHEGRQEYLHPAVLTLVSPRGNVSGYLYGVQYDPEELRDTLIVARVGETSEALSKFILSCYHYEAPTGNGAIVAKIMQAGGLVFVLGFAFAVARYGIKRSHMNAHAHQVGSSKGHV